MSKSKFEFMVPEKMRMPTEDSYWVRDEEIEKLRQKVQAELDSGASEAYGCLEFKVQIRVVGYGANSQREAIPARIVDFDGGDGALFVRPPPKVRCSTNSVEAFSGEKAK